MARVDRACTRAAEAAGDAQEKDDEHVERTQRVSRCSEVPSCVLRPGEGPGCKRNYLSVDMSNANGVIPVSHTVLSTQWQCFALRSSCKSRAEQSSAHWSRVQRAIGEFDPPGRRRPTEARLRGALQA